MREFQTPFSQSVINCASPLFPWTVTYNGTFKKLNFCRIAKRVPVKGSEGINVCKVGIWKPNAHGEIHIAVYELGTLYTPKVH